MKKKMAHILLSEKSALEDFPVDKKGCKTQLSQLEKLIYGVLGDKI